MKLKYTLMAWLGLVGTACTNQDFEEKYVDAGQVQVTAGIAKSRVSFNEADNMTYAYWQDGDAITLGTPTQGSLNYTATVSEEDATTATFAPESGSLKDIDGETVYACYPASTITDGVVVLPVTDKWTDEKPLPFAYAVSSITDSKVNLSFDHTFAFLKLTLTAKALESVTSSDGDKSVHRLSVKSASGTLGVVSGTFNFEDKNVTITEGSDEVVLTLSKAFNPAEETERSVYIPVLPQSGDVAIAISLLHGYEGGEDVLLEMEKQTPADGLVKGYVYDLTLTGNSSAVIEGDSAEIHLAEAGTLSNYITDENKYTIKSLKLSGYLNGDDIRLLREMAGRYRNGDKTDGSLTDLDVAEATIVEGGGSYYFSNYTENNVWGDSFFIETNLVNVVLPENITIIEANAFEKCIYLETVVMSEGITSIGRWAFRGCESLKSIAIPNSVLIIGERSFENCNVETITFSEGSALTTIDYGAFWGAGLQTVTLPESLTSIGDLAFCGCSSLVSANIPDAVTSIGESAFNGCSSLARCSMGSGVTSIGEQAFNSCTVLSSITLPEGLTSIESAVFHECEALQTIVIPDAVTIIGDNAFFSCSSLKSITIGKGVTTIEHSAFRGCTQLKEVLIPDGVISIENYAFSVCDALESVSLGNNLKTIGEEAFYNSGLKSISIPESVTSIGAGAFAATSLTEALNVLVDAESVFSGCSSLAHVVINEKSKKVGEDAFYNCKSLINITLPESITSIGTGAFHYCSSLESIEIPDAVTSVGAMAFESCTALAYAKLSNNLTKINACMFQYCEALTSIVIPDAVITIDLSAFRASGVLSSVTLGKNVTSIASSVFDMQPISEVISYASTPPSILVSESSGTFSASYIDKETAKLYVPKGSLAAYQKSDWATCFGNIIEMDE